KESHRWYTLGEHGWYTLGEHGWYTLGEYGLVHFGRLLTALAAFWALVVWIGAGMAWVGVVSALTFAF
ncbi:MAG: hypothetical protein H7837_01760, partial [Magnetococcus sp. MYC-9]